MSGIVTRSLPVTGNALNCESRKKPSRKRHRNKSKNCNLKKKRLKKFHGRKKVATSKLNPSKFDFMPSNNQIMSNWYWSNYRKAVEWQEKHKVAYWKACALALFEENRHLLQIINQLHPGMYPELSVTHNLLINGFGSGERNTNLCQSNDSANVGDYINYDDDDDDDDDDDNDDSENINDDETNENIEFEMSEEMIEFFEKSYKHKMELKELKEKELLHNAEDEVKQIQANKIKRSAEMNLLYGDGASMITGMETAVQLSFEKYCDTKSPKYWPNIPFRL